MVALAWKAVASEWFLMPAEGRGYIAVSLKMLGEAQVRGDALHMS